MIAKTDTIDLIAVDKDGNLLLVIEESGEWRPEMNQMFWAKLNKYVASVLSGEFVQKFPEAAGAPVLIRVMTANPPSPETAAVFEKAIKRLARFRIGFEHSVFKEIPEE